MCLAEINKLLMQQLIPCKQEKCPIEPQVESPRSLLAQVYLIAKNRTASSDLNNLIRAYLCLLPCPHEKVGFH